MNQTDFPNPLLWQHETHEPGKEYALLGVAALISEHEYPRNLFLDCLAAYTQSGLAEAINKRLQEMEAHWSANPEELLSQQQVYQSRLDEKLPEIQKRPFLANELLVDTHLEPFQEEWRLEKDYPAPHFDTSVDLMASLPALGNSMSATDAIRYWVGIIIHRPNVIRTYNGLENDPLIQALTAIAYGDKEARAKSRIGRRLATDLRKAAEKEHYHSPHGEGLSRRAQQWAAVWQIFNGRCLKATQSGMDLLAGLKRSKDISVVCAPFNAEFGVHFPKGPERANEDVLPRGYHHVERISPTQW